MTLPAATSPPFGSIAKHVPLIRPTDAPGIARMACQTLLEWWVRPLLTFLSKEDPVSVHYQCGDARHVERLAESLILDALGVVTQENRLAGCRTAEDIAQALRLPVGERLWERR